MRTHTIWRFAAVAATAALWTATPQSSVQSPTQSQVQLPQFRAGVTLVPVEVRVVDQDGNPVRNLTKADFAVREDGQPQEIAHFQAVEVDGTTDAARTFLIVLGRGRLNDPTKAVQALVDFVRTSCLPADRVGVFAYNRATELTTDHEAVARFLEAYRDGHRVTEALLVRDNTSGIRPPPMTAETSAALDGLFESVPELRGHVKDLAGGSGNALSRFNDWHYLKTALGYLTTIPGDKHALVLTERVFPAPRQSDDPLENYLFRLATSARAALSFIHTGGMDAPSVSVGRLTGGAVRLGSLLGRLAQRDLADQTGGTSAFFQYAARPLDALDRATRSYYLIGYYPAREILPHQYRRVDVSVSKAGLKLLYRHGFQAQPKPSDDPADYRKALTESRTEEAAAHLLYRPPSGGPSGITWDLKLKINGVRRSAAGEVLQVEVAFDAWLAMFTKVAARHVADFDLTLLADDEERNVIGEHKQHLRVELTDAEFARSKRQWPTFDIDFDVKGRPAYVRGVLFQFETDRVAAAQTRVRR